MSASLRTWEADDRPVAYAQPIADLAATLRRRGYVVGTIGNDAHLDDVPPEDHCPFSATGWPNPNPYPYVHALDIMAPAPGAGLPGLTAVGARILADRNAGVPGAGWLKYMNWTDGDGHCHHEKWQPTHVTTPSSDIGHIHLSCRTDFTHSPAAAGYDPSARVALPPPVSAPAGGGTPSYPGVLLRYVPGRPMMRSTPIRAWQQRMAQLRYTIGVDGVYGPQSQAVCRAFQSSRGLAVDGIVGPITWRAAFGEV